MESEAKPSPSSSSPSTCLSSQSPRKPKRDAKWHSLMRRRREYLHLRPKQTRKPKRNKANLKKRPPLPQFVQERHKCLQDSHGASWTRVSYIAKGGYGSVFYAERRIESGVIPTKFAVKSALLDDSFSLKHEKRVLSDLSACPHLVKCFGEEVTESSDGHKVYNLLLEYCSGMSLNARIRAVSGRSGLAEGEVRCYTRHVLLGLEYMHSRGFIHCDIKPDNILLVPDGEWTGRFAAKIADFGLTRALLYDDDGLGSMRGTTLYMPPEQVRDGKLLYSGDVWALGCSVLEMLTGNWPWDYLDVDNLMHVIGYTEQLPTVPGSLSDLAKDFLDKCLRKFPEERWTTEELLQHPFVAID